MTRLVVLVSGSGSNLQAILDACRDGVLAGRAQVVGVLANRPDAYGLTRAAEAGVPTEVLALGAFKRQGGTRAEYDVALAERVAAFAPDLVVLAGFMLVLGTGFLDRFPDRVINLHPALPGELPGTHAIERAWKESLEGLRTRTGVMVHIVVPEVDAGPVIATAEIPIEPGEPLEDLEARVHRVEHTLLVQAIARIIHPAEEAP